MTIAAHIAVAVAAAQNIEQYENALDSRTIIAQACGLVRERYNIDSIRAFAPDPPLLDSERQAARPRCRTDTHAPPAARRPLTA